MGDWIKRLEIKDLLSDDNSPENAVKVGSAMADRIESKLANFLHDDPELSEIVSDFKAVGDANQFALSAFNDTLGRFYDWADDNRVWLGL